MSKKTKNTQEPTTGIVETTDQIVPTDVSETQQAIETLLVPSCESFRKALCGGIQRGQLGYVWFDHKQSYFKRYVDAAATFGINEGVSLAYCEKYCGINPEHFKTLFLVVGDDNVSYRMFNNFINAHLSQVDYYRIAESNDTMKFVNDRLKESDSSCVLKNTRVRVLPTHCHYVEELPLFVGEYGFNPDLIVLIVDGCNAFKGTFKNQLNAPFDKLTEDEQTRILLKDMCAKLNCAMWYIDTVKEFYNRTLGDLNVFIRTLREHIQYQRATLYMNNPFMKEWTILNGIIYNTGTFTIRTSDTTEFDNPNVDNW